MFLFGSSWLVGDFLFVCMCFDSSFPLLPIWIDLLRRNKRKQCSSLWMPTNQTSPFFCVLHPLPCYLRLIGHHEFQKLVHFVSPSFHSARWNVSKIFWRGYRTDLFICIKKIIKLPCRSTMQNTWPSYPGQFLVFTTSYWSYYFTFCLQNPFLIFSGSLHWLILFWFT